MTLPAGVGLNPSGADGLQACPLLTGREPAKETQEEKGEVTGIDLERSSPRLPGILEGRDRRDQDAVVAERAGRRGIPRNALKRAEPLRRADRDVHSRPRPRLGVRVKLAGEVQPNPVTGQLVATFKETPQLPFEELILHFFGGSRAPLGTPALCGGYTTTASIAPWSGNPPVESSSEFQITSGPERRDRARPAAVYAVVDGGHDEHPGGRVQPVHDDDEPRRRQPEPPGDRTAYAARACWGRSPA